MPSYIATFIGSGGTVLKTPTADGTSGQFMQTDGSGQLSFADAGVDVTADYVWTGDHEFQTTPGEAMTSMVSLTSSTSSTSFVISSQEFERFGSPTSNFEIRASALDTRDEEVVQFVIEKVGGGAVASNGTLFTLYNASTKVLDILPTGAFIFQAGLSAPSSVLAKGTDVNGRTVGIVSDTNDNVSFGGIDVSGVNAMRVDRGANSADATNPDIKFLGRIAVGADPSPPLSRLHIHGGDFTQSENSTTSIREVFTRVTSWVDSTDATRKGRADFNVYDTAAREFMSAEASGTAPKLSFFGVAPVTRPQVTAAGVSAADLLTALDSLGILESV